MEDTSPSQLEYPAPRRQASPPVSEEDSRAATPEQTREELREAIQGSNDVLITMNTTLSLTPDTITVDRVNVSITRRIFLRAAQTESIPIEDILDIKGTVGPFFGTVKIVNRVLNSEKHHDLGRFWRDDAKRLKRILDGYVIALRRNIDCNALPTDELVKLLDKLGEDEHTA